MLKTGLLISLYKMKKLQKAILLSFLIFIVGCGYTPLLNVKNINFYISEIKFNGDKNINKYIKDNLERHLNYVDGAIGYDLEIYSSYDKNISNRDQAGNPKNYDLSISVNIVYKSLDEKIYKTYNKNISLATQSKKIEEKELETKYKKDLSNKISEEIIFYLITK